MLSSKIIKLAVGLIIVITIVLIHDWQNQAATPALQKLTGSAASALKSLPVKGRAPKTGYTRAQFGDGWASAGSCDTRELILRRDLSSISLGPDGCTVESGRLLDPYTGQVIVFKRGSGTSDDVQIDHVVALSNAWQTGAQQLSFKQREAFANDPIELLAVDGDANQQKSDGDAATWLPKNKSFRCSYIARQIAIKAKYRLWVTAAERDAMTRVLASCPNQPLP
ncbi:MAG TPA: HNH endonuclease family protein [Candidatus Saccharimonadales bacterium]|nr:HNH endonuclease family protein [Candidatus Saccharimonadales bacterium]